MYATDRRQTHRCQTKASLNAPPIRGGGMVGHNKAHKLTHKPTVLNNNRGHVYIYQ